MFSLEDDEGNDMFITQTPSTSDGNTQELNNQSGGELFLGIEVDDFQSPCSSLVSKSMKQPIYSDISDDDMEWEIQSSQKTSK